MVEVKINGIIPVFEEDYKNSHNSTGYNYFNYG